MTTPALYLGPNTSYAQSPHASDILNAAIQIYPRNHGQLAIGTFSYNIYLSTLVDTNAITTAHLRLYCGSPTSMIFPSWFNRSQLIGEWSWANAGALGTCSPPPPVDQYTWDVASKTGTSPVWTPTASCPVYNKPFALIATIEYIVDSVPYGVGIGQAAKDPCAAVLCSLAFSASATPVPTGNRFAQNSGQDTPSVGAAGAIGLAGLGWVINRRNRLREEALRSESLKDPKKRTR